MRVVSLLPLAAILGLLAIWLGMFRHMVHNPVISGNERILWLIGFVLAGLPTAILYFFTRYQKTS